VRIIVGFAPGGGTDALARVVSQKLTEMWKQQVIVETKAGASGVLAAEYVAQQPSRRQHAADGAHQQPCAGAQPAAQAALQRRTRLHAHRAGGRHAQPADRNPQLKALTVKDIVALCKAEPGKVSFGSAGNGSAQHLALEMFKLQAKVDALHVPYKGSGPLLIDLIGGQIQYSFETMTAATPHVKSGKVIGHCADARQRAKATRACRRCRSGLPRFRGHHLVRPGRPGQAAGGHRQKVMNEDVNTVLAMPDVQEKLETYGAEDGGGSDEKFADFIKRRARATRRAAPWGSR
jgi:tripartite-type tricarboxylate transporter receptor subunit TctC